MPRFGVTPSVPEFGPDDRRNGTRAVLETPAYSKKKWNRASPREVAQTDSRTRTPARCSLCTTHKLASALKRLQLLQLSQPLASQDDRWDITRRKRRAFGTRSALIRTLQSTTTVYHKTSSKRAATLSTLEEADSRGIMSRAPTLQERQTGSHGESEQQEVARRQNERWHAAMEKTATKSHQYDARSSERAHRPSNAFSQNVPSASRRQ